MGKRGIALAVFASFIFLILASPAYAEYKELVHEDWQNHTSNFTVDDKTFVIKATESPTRALILIGNDITDVENNSCVEKFNMSICMTDAQYPGEGLHRVFDPFDFKFYIEVYYHLAKLRITRTIKPTTFTVGEKAEIETTIYNNGSLKAENIEFVDSFPGFDIDYVYGCIKKGKNITWSGRLSKEREHKCTYWITAVNETAYSSKASATYLAGIGNRTGYDESSEVTITVPNIELKMNTALSNSSLWAGDNTSITIMLENTHSEEDLRNLFLQISLPESMSIINHSPRLSVSGKTLNWNSELEPNEKINFTALLKAEKSGNFSIDSKADYRYDSLYRQVEKKDGILIKLDSLALQEMAYNTTARPGQNASFNVNLINPSARYSFKNVKINITTNLPISNTTRTYFEFDEMLQKRFINIMDWKITAPHWDSLTTYTTNFNISYETEYNEKITLNEEKKFTVDPDFVPEKPKPKIVVGGVDLKVDTEEIAGKLERFGWEKVLIIVVVTLFLFIASLFNFIRKMQKKVAEYE